MMNRSARAIGRASALLVLVSVAACARHSMPEQRFAFEGPVAALRAMTFNVWESGQNVDGGRDKIVSAIVESGADVVAMQESRGAASFVAGRLGWYSFQPSRSVAVVSRFPITETFGPTFNHAGAGVRLLLNDEPKQEIVLWSVHLSSAPYGPYQACLEELSAAEILAGQKGKKLREVKSILASLEPFVVDAGEAPVILAGDLNTPSHRDWIPAAAGLHCGHALSYPPTEEIEKLGLIDAYRLVSPDPVGDPANTWSPVYETYVYQSGKPEPMDRIDMVYFVGDGVSVEGAKTFVVGAPGQSPDHQGNAWPSDHKAVVVDFSLRPAGE